MLKRTLKSTGYLLVAMQLIIWSMASTIVHATEDTTAPTLTSLSFSQTTVDVTQSPQDITVQLQATDSESSVKYANVRLRAPVGEQGNDISVSWSSTGPTTWQGTMHVQEYIADGDWEVNVEVEDTYGNIRSMHGQALVDQGFIGYVHIDSIHDSVNPVVHAVTFTDTSADVTTQEKSIDISVTISDAASGILGTAVIFSPPSRQSSEISAIFTLRSSTQDGERWDGTVRVPRYIQNGFWEARLMAYDKAGNTAYMDGAALAAANFPSGISVVSQEDVVAPVIHDLTLSPAEVNTSESAQTVTSTVVITDGLSGVNFVSVIFSSPRANTNDIGASYNASTVNADGSVTWTSTFTIPQTAPIGEWKARIVADDMVGNTTSLNTQQLIDAGHDYKFLAHHGNQSTASASTTSSNFSPAPSEEELATLLNGTATQGLIIFYRVNDVIQSVNPPTLYPINTVDPKENVTRYITL